MAKIAQLSSKPRYEILDGLRGVAAILVVAFHLFESYVPVLHEQIINHGYLAVDFFFVLSGYVIGYAYDDRWGPRMNTWDFIKRRLVRLHPMYLMGTFIGLLLFYFTDGPMFPLVNETPWWRAIVAFLIAVFMVPQWPKLDIRGWQEINPLNGATWTLTWEYVANLLYAFFIRHLRTPLLGVLVGLSAFFTVDIAMDLDVFNVLGPYHGYTMAGGWGLSPDQLYMAFGRLFYPFFCGLLLFRLGKKITIKKNAWWWLALLVTVILAMPEVGGKGAPWMNGVYICICILVLFPLIVITGAGSTVEGKTATKLCKFLGEISYPLYVTHYPLIYIQMNWLANHRDAPVGQHIMVSVSIFIISIAATWAVYKLYDLPVREWLRKKVLVKNVK